MAVIGSTKWSCPSCTFHNWLSSVKCVLCGCAKPNDANPRKFRSQNPASLSWSKAPSSPNSNASSAPPQKTPEIICADFNYPSVLDPPPTKDPSMRTPRTKRWICGTCTYSNWPNANCCAMCGLQRIRSRNEASMSGRKEPSRSPKRAESILDYADIASYVGAVGGSGHVTSDENTPTHSRDSTVHPPKVKGGKHGNKTASNMENKSSNAKKWKCQKCTYSNWSRAMKCVMCQAKRRTPSPPLSDDSAHQNPITSGNATTTTTSATNSPTPPPATSSHPHHPHLSPANSNTALSSPSSTPAIQPSNSNTSSPLIPTSSEHQVSSSSSSSSPTPSTNHSSASSLTKTVGGSSSNPNLSCVGRAPQPTGTHPPVQLKSASDEVRQIRNCFTNLDWLFINACLGVVNNDEASMRAYLRQDGDRARQLTEDDCLVLGESSSFSVGSTLVHLAIKFQRSDLLGLLLTPAPSEARKRLPSESNPDLATSIREEVGLSLRQQRGDWQCFFLTQLTTFTLPAAIRKFCSAIQKRILDEIVDRDVEKELSSTIINWSSELVDDLSSRLYPLWNRTAGDCLLDSVLQAAWGVVDRDSTLRRAMADSLVDGASMFYERWQETEQRQSLAQGFSLDEDQLRQDWAAVLALADQRGKSLEQTHIFALVHILRRPIVVYGVRVVKNYRGENLGFANFEGVYLPLLWESSFCWKTPLALAYTRGHFSALVSISAAGTTGAWSNRSCDNHVTYLPLVDSEGQLLPVHFLSEQEIGCEERLLNQYCECHVTQGAGTLTAKQEVTSQQEHTLIAQLVEQWLDRFHRMDKRREAAACTYSDSDN